MIHCDYHSPCGMVRLSARAGRLYRVRLLGAPRERKPTGATHAPGGLAPFVEMLDRYFDCEPVQCDPERLCMDGMGHFQRRVYEALAKVGFGSAVTYSGLAVMSGAPRAHRAVGNALGANPLPIFIPCHRVVRADGSLGGFGCGVPWKRRLLEHEGHVVRRGRLVLTDVMPVTTCSGG